MAVAKRYLLPEPDVESDLERGSVCDQRLRPDVVRNRGRSSYPSGPDAVHHRPELRKKAQQRDRTHDLRGIREGIQGTEKTKSIRQGSGGRSPDRTQGRQGFAQTHLRQRLAAFHFKAMSER